MKLTLIIFRNEKDFEKMLMKVSQKSHKAVYITMKTAHNGHLCFVRSAKLTKKTKKDLRSSEK